MLLDHYARLARGTAPAASMSRSERTPPRRACRAPAAPPPWHGGRQAAQAAMLLSRWVARSLGRALVGNEVQVVLGQRDGLPVGRRNRPRWVGATVSPMTPGYRRARRPGTRAGQERRRTGRWTRPQLLEQADRRMNNASQQGGPGSPARRRAVAIAPSRAQQDAEGPPSWPLTVGPRGQVASSASRSSTSTSGISDLAAR